MRRVSVARRFCLSTVSPIRSACRAAAAAAAAPLSAAGLSADAQAATWSRPSSACRSPIPIAGSRTTSATTPRCAAWVDAQNKVTNALPRDAAAARPRSRRG